MSDGNDCKFLSYLDLHIPYFWCPDEQRAARGMSVALEMVKDKKYGELRAMAESGELAPLEPLPAMGCSLLSLAMRQGFRQRPVLADILLLLDTVARRGEVLDQDLFHDACKSGVPEMVEAFLQRGATATGDALHHLVSRIEDGHSAIAIGRLLLAAKAAVDDMGTWRATPLVSASKGIGNGTYPMMKWLLEQRADPNGASGLLPPLHANLSSWASAKTVELLVQHRADVNLRDQVTGSTPLHCALSGHCKFALAKLLTTLGADASIKDDAGMKPGSLLMANKQPERAAELEGRPMNQEELRLRAALDHVIARRFEKLHAQSVGWIIGSDPGRIRERKDGFDSDSGESGSGSDREEAQHLNVPLGDLLMRKPKSVVLRLPLTRYCELHEDVQFTCPPEGFTFKDLLIKVYEYYQAPCDESQLRRIRQHFARGQLGDAFGYIRNNVGSESEAGEGGEGEGGEGDDGTPAAHNKKKQRVPRIELRGDSRFFEGLREAAYFEDEGTLFARLCLGS
mmetsp:Transcript_22665/g.42690  ORF Transcript_22665/g.42690 Transcript_22665/m.42690 type:complete len:512 (-) Transcript_22665:197-1732(-)